jgi:hypothetical protein
MNFLIGLLVIGVLTAAAVEFGVWIMKGMLGGDDGHHASRTPLARIVGYAIGGIALVAFIMLATGGAGFWPIAAVVFGIPLALILIYRKPAALGD